MCRICHSLGWSQNLYSVETAIFIINATNIIVNHHIIGLLMLLLKLVAQNRVTKTRNKVPMASQTVRASWLRRGNWAKVHVSICNPLAAL